MITFLDTRKISNVIHNIRYCGECKNLSIRFKSNLNKVYVYKNVEEDVFNDFATAHSLGRYYNQNIQGYYEVIVMGICDPICFCNYNEKKEDLFCRACGTKFNEEDNYCSHCGKKRT